MIYYIGSGSGGVEEMVLEMEKSQVMYALGTYVCVCEHVLWGDEDINMCRVGGMKRRERGWREGGSM